jgi:hypothetical protein
LCVSAVQTGKKQSYISSSCLTFFFLGKGLALRTGVAGDMSGLIISFKATMLENGKLTVQQTGHRYCWIQLRT